MIQIIRGSGGSPTALVGGTYLHSKYRPSEEAVRFISRQDDLNDASVVLVLGPGLGYVFDALRTFCPDAGIVAVFYSTECHENRVGDADEMWHPGSETSLHDFLESALPEWQISGLKMVHWEPSSKAFPSRASVYADEVTAHIRKKTGSLLTTAAFGKLWLRNSVTNFLRIQRFLPFSPPRGAIVIAAAGPSLSESIDTIHEHRNEISVWALPSSVMALTARGVVPDLVVQTDAGFYARHHMYSYGSTPDWTVAMPLTSARPPDCSISEAAVLNQGTLFETDLLHDLAPVTKRVGWNGTVAGTALDLAESYHLPVVFAGLDLCASDLHSHVRPHPFDVLHMQRCCRHHPTYSVMAERMYDMYPERIAGRDRTSPALKTYAAWFQSKMDTCTVPVYRLNATGVPVPGMGTLDSTALDDILRKSRTAAKHLQPETAVEIDERQKVETVLSCVSSWKGLLASAVSDQSVDEKSKGFDLLYFLCAQHVPSLRRTVATRNAAEHASILREMKGEADQVMTDLERIASAHQ